MISLSISTLVLVLFPSDSRELFRQLDSPTYEVREWAENVLASRADCTYMIRGGLRSNSPEVSFRCYRILVRHKRNDVRRVLDELDKENPYYPYIDSLWWHDGENHYDSYCRLVERKLYYRLCDFKSKCERELGKEKQIGEPYPAYRMATRKYVVELLEEGTHPFLVRMMLWKMWTKEAKLCSAMKYPYKGPQLFNSDK